MKRLFLFIVFMGMMFSRLGGTPLRNNGRLENEEFLHIKYLNTSSWGSQIYQQEIKLQNNGLLKKI